MYIKLDIYTHTHTTVQFWVGRNFVLKEVQRCLFLKIFNKIIVFLYSFKGTFLFE